MKLSLTDFLKMAHCTNQLVNYIMYIFRYDQLLFGTFAI